MNNLSPLKKSFFTRKRIIVIAVLALLLGGVGFWRSGGDTPIQYAAEPVKRGDIAVTISASGTLQPVQSVDVGSELSGTLQSIRVDENDAVKKNQVLATLDPSKLNDAVTRSRASVVSAKAQVLVAEATLQEATATLHRQQQVFQMSGGRVPSASELETAEANTARARANVAVAKAAVTQSVANLKSDETNLQKTVIRSPINGVVLARKVEVGQTVAASLSAPTLFNIAEDLSQMQINVNVDEADVSAVKANQPVSFNVSGYPNETFSAKIVRVGVGSTMTDNVVTYKTVLAVENPKLLLRPGMTAVAKITTADRHNVLMVPNAALRFSPPRETSTEQSGNSFLQKLIPSRPRMSKKVSESITQGSRQKVWILKEGKAVKVMVSVGVTNGRMTEITEGDIDEGAQVIIGFKSKI